MYEMEHTFADKWRNLLRYTPKPHSHALNDVIMHKTHCNRMSMLRPHQSFALTNFVCFSSFHKITHRFVFIFVKTPLLDSGGVTVLSETCDSLVFKLFHFLQDFCELNRSVESSSPPRTFTG